SRVVHIVRRPGDPRPTVQISGVTIQNGKELSGTNGGAIAVGVGARLILRNTIITNSRAGGPGHGGGGIDNEGELFIFDSTISENIGGNGGGGGIANRRSRDPNAPGREVSGRLFISATSIDGNTSEGFGGGGIFNSGGTVRIEESTVSRSEQHGGATGGGDLQRWGPFRNS